MSTKNTPASPTADREIVTSRLFNAPVELVWRAWTDPKHLVNWWGPRGFRNTFQEFAVKPGGVWRFIMHGPDGRDYQNKIVFKEVVPHELISYTHGDDVDEVQFQTTITFTTKGEQTEVTMRGVFPTAGAREHAIREFGALEGASQTMDRFVEQVSAMAVEGGEFVITRTFDAPRDLVWKTLTDPEHMKHWSTPKNFTPHTAHMDFKPGGSYHYCNRSPEGHEMWGKVYYREIKAPEHIIYINTFSDASGAPTRHPMSASWPLEMLTTYTLTESGGKTTLKITWVPYNATEAERATFAAAHAGMTQGWSGMLETFGKYLTDVQTDKRADAEFADRPFTISRTFDAPRELVWKAFTEGERLQHWWGPKGFKITVKKFDLRPGGVFHYCMRTPGGDDWWGRFIYREIVPQEKIVWVNSFSDEQGGLGRHPGAPEWPQEMLCVATFTEHNGKTTFTIEKTAINATEAERAVFNAGRPGMTQGWTGTLDQFGEYLAKHAVTDREIISTRVVKATREQVWKAWTDPKILALWWGPNGFTNTFEVYDLKPGGDWKFVMHGPDGTDYKNESVFVELRQPERWVIDHLSNPKFQVTATFVEEGGKTRITFRMLFETAAVCEAVKGIVVPSNEQNFDRLEVQLAKLA